MSTLLRRFAEQDAVVGDDAHRHALDVREAADQRGAVAGLELVELRAVDQAGDDLAHVKRLARIGGDDAVQLLGRKQRHHLDRAVQTLAPGLVRLEADSRAGLAQEQGVGVVDDRRRAALRGIERQAHRRQLQFQSLCRQLQQLRLQKILNTLQ